MNNRNSWGDTVTKKLILPVIIAWSVLAIVFGFLDLEISKAVANPESLWGNWGADYGEVPGWGFIAIAIAILAGSRSRDLSRQKVPTYVLIVLGMVVAIFGLVGGSQIIAVIGGGISVSLILFYVKAFDKDLKEYIPIAKITLLLVIIVPLIFIHVTKLSFGRVRFRDLEEDYTNYTPWFSPQGYTGHKSFPSGHAAMGWMLLPLLLLVKDKDLKDPKRVTLTAFVIGWGVFVASSRVAVGAHYASDVLFSTGAAAVTMIFLYWNFYFRIRKDG